ncbi:MAG: ComF family protein [Oscillospiraceae bacterium]|nr:ComF family protein [Oscillospiraceae bacterium]
MITDRILNLLFPPKCVLCGKILEKDETDLCHSCRIDSPECPGVHKNFSFLDSWVAVWYYKGYIRESLLRYKFHRARHYAPIYGRILAMRIQREYPEGFDLLTWVPISRLRKFRRGYDQVELLAEAVAQELGMRAVSTLKKIRHNRPQSAITGQAQRRANVLGVYEVVSGQVIAGKRILLLDDIITTGTTAGECARVLLTAGAKEVHCGCVAASHHD